jgi:hypothetical protein
MKPKALRKKIRRLEARQQKDARKLAKLKQKLEAAKAEKKSAAYAGGIGEAAKPAAEKKRRRAKKAKRKLNLSPERRAQLAAAMKARWAAKRAAAAATPEKTTAPKDFTIGEKPQAK